MQLSLVDSGKEISMFPETSDLSQKIFKLPFYFFSGLQMKILACSWKQQ